MSKILLRFVHISDTHITVNPDASSQATGRTAEAGARALVNAVNALPFQPDFVMHTGDIADSNPASYELARDMLQELRAPVYYVRGNSDTVEGIQTILMGSSEIMKPYFYYEFELNGVQIICLDTNGPAQPPAGYIVPEQLAWLDNLCTAPDSRPLLVMLHHNVIKIGDVPLLDDQARVANGEDLHQILVKARQRLRGVFYGHIHQPLDHYRDGILYSCVPSSWDQFYDFPGMDIHVTGLIRDPNTLPGFSVVTLSDESTTIRRHSFRVAPDE